MILICKIIKRILGIYKLMMYKVIYNKRFTFDTTNRVNYSLICRNFEEGTITLKKRVVFRENIILNVSSTGNLVIEDDTFLNDGVSINCRNSIIIGKGTIIGQNVLIYDHDHDYRKGAIEKFTHYVEGEVTIGNKVWIGAGVIILKDSVIGDNAVIGAGAIVNGTIPANTIYYNKIEKYNKVIM